ncbi:UDP-N-acetylmuramate dehydrogenase [Holzapfeliella floricola]|uniref:UDP-N-acetylenolpyruvoylglucosamine reductase n=1 Tax=Holzapfeliella floricola DSM 23037 = JCM 16512 TaxID=1423744 RepID=A0A0R2DHK0_9LACO|nr:UDP-N-acetylmuramate dehydrogenase [Holzapfeliella floricola]KRN03513.1 udp-n-acetylenolpyruvoylglucosamine reductase [Holzapfeliella floricola DSM 23037 = JCM 16512]
MNIKELKEQGFRIDQNILLNQFTYTKTGGPAEFLAFPKNITQIEQLLQIASDKKLPITIIGNASNLIIREGGIKGLVLILTEMKEIEVKGNRITAQAGAKIIETSETAYKHSLGGLEFAAGIPGSVGGAVFMNAGAYGGEIKDVLKTVTVLTRQGELKTYQNTDLHFSYRHSLLQDNDDIVLEATFELQRDVATNIRAMMDDFNERRASKQPLEYPSCGSVFKRPEGHFTGPLIIEAGLQGKIIGGAQISTKHAGFIVNINHATATDYLELIELVQKTIWKKNQIKLVPEVRIIGDEAK